jgi:hypothetical protein
LGPVDSYCLLSTIPAFNINNANSLGVAAFLRIRPLAQVAKRSERDALSGSPRLPLNTGC